ncbi:MAG: hypothetical protein B7Z37_23225, partial [Verrucomicrobia bacterium 12-59-8]
MPSTYTSRLRLEKIGNGEKSGSWGTTENGTRDLFEIAVAGYLEIAMGDANVTLTTVNGASDQARYHILKMTGTNTATRDVIAPAVSKTYCIENGTTQAIRIKTSGGVAVTIPSTATAFVFCDGTDFALASAFNTANIEILNSVVPAADRLMYFTGASTASLATFTSFGRSLVDDADASAGRTTLGLGSLATASTINNSNWSGTALSVGNGGTGANDAAGARTAFGLVIGTNVQAYHANLAQVAGLTFAADTLPYGNGAGTLTLTSLTSFARTLLDDADAATARATLGVTDGGTALQAANNLSDVSSAASSRTNLGLGSLAVLSTINNGNWSGTVLSVANGGTGSADAASARTALGITATGSDTTYAYRANNLSDLSSASSARTNLGLGTAAVVNTGTSGATVALNNGANTWGAAQIIATGGASNSTDLTVGNSQSIMKISGGDGAYAFIDSASWGVAIRTQNTNRITVTNAGDIGFATMPTVASVAMVTISSTDTLSNKTLSSPTLSGTIAGSPTFSGTPVFSGGISVDQFNDPQNVRGVSLHWAHMSSAADGRGIFGNNLYAHWNGASVAFKTGNTGSVGYGALSVYEGGLYLAKASGATTQDGTVTPTWVAIPTISSTDTLSNKTLSSPTLSGTVAGTP